MINPSDLRLNNLFSHQGNLKKVFSITQTGVMATDLENSNVLSFCPMEEMEPIPISEEWLLRLGFVKPRYLLDDDVLELLFVNYEEELRRLQAWFDGEVSIANDEHPKSESYDVSYIYREPFVHQFQNLCFALTGEELQITTESTECKTCGGNCKPGKALKNETLYGEPDIVGKRTVYEGEGEAKIKDVLKCQDCGHSFIPKQKTPPKGRVKNVN